MSQSLTVDAICCIFAGVVGIFAYVKKLSFDFYVVKIFQC